MITKTGAPLRTQYWERLSRLNQAKARRDNIMSKLIAWCNVGNPRVRTSRLLEAQTRMRRVNFYIRKLETL